jgi:polyhydroxybutyrate depolymerase
MPLAFLRHLRASRRSAFTLVGVALALPACFGANALPGASAPPVLARPAAPSASAGVCAGRQAQPVNSTWTVDVGGKTRRFVVHVPPAYSPSAPMPVVLNFHGYRMSPNLQEWLSRMSAKADSASFIVVYPEGTGSAPSFNAGICCGDAARDNVDDVAFTRAMLDALEANLCVDTRRVFAAGMSNGAFMSHRLACEVSDRIAAIAAVSGVTGVDDCAPKRAVPVLDFHGTQDPTVPYTGDPRRHFRSVLDSTRGWVSRDGCTEAPVTVLSQNDVQCVAYRGCRDHAEVELCTIDGAGHTWPGGADVPAIANQGTTTHTIVANDLIWAFFQSHPMPEPPAVQPR